MTGSQDYKDKTNLSIKNTDLRTSKSELAKKVAKFALYGSAAVGAGMLCSELALAGPSKFDIDAGATGGTKPLIDAIIAHWGKGILLTSSVSAVLGEGDGKQRAVRAGLGAGAAGVVVLTLISVFT